MSVAANIVDVSAGNFQTDVVEKSMQMPVLLEFYAESAEPSRQLSIVLRQLAGEYQGKFLLARVDVQSNAQLVQQLGIRTLPSIKVISQGKMVQDLEGPQDAQALRSLLDQLTLSPMDRIREQINSLLADRQRSRAIEMLQQLVSREPQNYGLQVELCDLLIMEDRGDEAKQMLSLIPGDTAGIEKPESRLEFNSLVADLPSIVELQSGVEENGNDLQLQLHLAYRLIVDDQMEAALDLLLSMLQIDRDWEEQKARTTMIKVFNLLGKGNELATRYRRKMFTFLH